MRASPMSGRTSSLRARLLRALAVGGALPLALLVLFEATHFSRYERDAAEERTAGVAARIARQTGSYLLEHRRAIESLAHLLGHHPMDAAETEEALHRFRERYPGFLTMLAASRDGTVSAASPATDSSGGRHADRRLSVADRDYFREALASGRSYVSPAFQGRGFGTDPIVAVSAPVRSIGSAEWAGVVEGSLDLRRLQEIVQPAGGVPGTEAVIADAMGVVVFSSIPGVAPLSPRPADEPSALYATARVEGLGWTVTARVARGAAYAGRNRFLIATAAAAIVALGLGFWLARRNALQIARPLRSLADSVRSYEAGGVLALPEAPAAPTEVRDLIDGFGTMADRLRSAHDELRAVLAGLEREVQERTETLRASDERFRQLADNINAVFWVRGLKPPGILYLSPAYERIWERPRTELQADPGVLWETIHPDDRERVAAAVARQPEGPYRQEYRIVCPSGEVKWIRSIGFPVHGPGGEVIRIAGLSEDATEAHRIDQLRQDLTHTMVHDLRSPLTGIRAGLEVAQSEEASPALRRESLEVAQRSVDKLVFLIDAILDVSRLESGRFPLEVADANLLAVAAEVLSSLRPQAQARQVGVGLTAAPGLPDVPCDAGLVGRVLQNLIGNALKFTPSGGQVEVRLEVTDGAVRLSVSDSGPGIEPELSTRLFDKFVTGRRAGRGSGLGLAFCRLAVEAHGGAIGLDTQVGSGATFHFTLPLARPAPAPTPSD